VGAGVNAAVALHPPVADNYPPAVGEDAGVGRRHLFLIECPDAADALVRLLGPFAVQQARLVTVAASIADGRLVARIEVEGMSPDRAQNLSLRLKQLPAVTGVSLGWRG
jgi:hypothetical protein